MKTNSVTRSDGALLLLVGLLAFSTNVFGQSGASTNAPSVPPGLDTPAYEPGEVLVKFKGDVNDEQIATAFRGAGLQMIRHIQTAAMRAKGEIGITRARTAMPVEQAIATLNQLPGVEHAQPNWLYTHQATADDPYFKNGALWGMYGAGTSPANEFGSGAAAAWANGFTGSGDVYIGIIDEGIQYDHPDLAANMWTNPNEIPGNGVDDDNNGVVDDIHGINAILNNGDIYDARWDDHGTHVAGTIGAVGGNGAGVVGMNWNVKLISGKFLGSRNGSTADAIQAIDYMTDLKASKGLNIVALNNSWGGGAYDPALVAAIQRAADANILFIAAAGNSGINTDVSPSYPAGYNVPNVISVTAITSSGGQAYNYGLTTVDLGAPGVNIYSTLPGGKYGYASGTSMATPHVTGAAPLFAACNPTANATEIKNAILSSVTPTPSLAGKTVTGGRLNVSGFAPANPDAPAAPTSLTATTTANASGGAITLNWNDTSNNETGFEIVRTSSSATPTTITVTVGANVTSYEDTLSDHGTYTYSVRAYNATYFSAPAVVTVTLAQPATAVFKRFDTTTQGSWLGKYGTQGYRIANHAALDPAYGTVEPVAASHTWASSTTDVRALQNVTGTTRLATCWNSGTGDSFFELRLPFTDYLPHRVSLYCLDWEPQDRQQKVEVYDLNSGGLLAGVTLDGYRSMANGIYLTFEISGPVRIKVTHIKPFNLALDNAVVSGVFFDPASAPAAPTELAATPGHEQVSLTWAASPGAVKYVIERATAAGGSYDVIGEVTTTSYLDTVDLANGTTYCYRVSAVNIFNESSSPSSEVSATPVAIPPDFSLSASSMSVKRGASTWSEVRVVKVGGFDEQITFSASGFPPGVTYEFGALSADNICRLNVQTTSTTKNGTYTIIITGTGGGITRTAPPITLKVTK